MQKWKNITQEALGEKIAWIVVIVALKLQNAEGYLIGTIPGILAIFFYVVRYNQMIIYVEDRVYKKNEK